MDNHYIALEARRAELHAQVHRAAFLHYVRKGRIPRDVAEMVAATGSWQELVAWRARRNGKYNPNWQSQPRVPTGSTGGGQWTDGGGSGETARPACAAQTPWLFTHASAQTASTERSGAGAYGART